MRLSFILVVAAATLLVNCNAVTEPEQAQLSNVVTLNAMKSVDAAPMKRFLRSIKTEEEDKSEDPESEDEERMVKLPSFKMLTPIDELLAKLSKIEAAQLANLNKYDEDILRKIKTTSGAAGRIQRWTRQELTPTAVANILKKYPTLSRDGAEWSAWKLYAAQYLRKAYSLKPTT